MDETLFPFSSKVWTVCTPVSPACFCMQEICWCTWIFDKQLGNSTRFWQNCWPKYNFLVPHQCIMMDTFSGYLGDLFKDFGVSHFCIKKTFLLIWRILLPIGMYKIFHLLWSLSSFGRASWCRTVASFGKASWCQTVTLETRVLSVHHSHEILIICLTLALLHSDIKYKAKSRVQEM